VCRGEGSAVSPEGTGSNQVRSRPNPPAYGEKCRDKPVLVPCRRASGSEKGRVVKRWAAVVVQASTERVCLCVRAGSAQRAAAARVNGIICSTAATRASALGRVAAQTAPASAARSGAVQPEVQRMSTNQRDRTVVLYVFKAAERR